ncbi:hypothetical protein PanWU01x14_178530, partial [Parasponia andersonii]
LENTYVAGNSVDDSVPLNNEATMIIEEIIPGPLNDEIVKERNLLQDGTDSEHIGLKKLNSVNEVGKEKMELVASGSLPKKASSSIYNQRNLIKNLILENKMEQQQLLTVQ